jgi:hypothetical protein
LNTQSLVGLVLGTTAWLIVHFFLRPNTFVPFISLGALAIWLLLLAPAMTAISFGIFIINSITGKPAFSEHTDDFVYGFTVGFDVITFANFLGFGGPYLT